MLVTGAALHNETTCTAAVHAHVWHTCAAHVLITGLQQRIRQHLRNCTVATVATAGAQLLLALITQSVVLTAFTTCTRPPPSTALFLDENVTLFPCSSRTAATSNCHNVLVLASGDAPLGNTHALPPRTKVTVWELPVGCVVGGWPNVRGEVVEGTGSSTCEVSSVTALFCLVETALQCNETEAAAQRTTRLPNACSEVKTVV
jgi:hypothetical protein